MGLGFRVYGSEFRVSELANLENGRAERGEDAVGLEFRGPDISACEVQRCFMQTLCQSLSFRPQGTPLNPKP